ncbi:MAG: Fur family transcriptional regulator [Elusimicrobiaceae bacterium]
MNGKQKAIHPLDQARYGELAARLAAAGYKNTGPRAILLRYFLAGRGHKTAEEIYLDLRGQGLGRATVFRNLAVFLKTGIAEPCQLAGKTGFELAGGPSGHHHHMVCVKCGMIIEFFSPEMEKLQESEVLKHNFRAITHTLEIRGVCARCAEKDAP